MKFSKWLPAAALMVLPLAAPVPAFAADSSTASPAVPQTSVNGLAVSGDVVLSGICQVQATFHPGDMVVFRAQVLESDGSALPAGTTVTVNLANGDTVKMSSHGTFFVGTYVIPPTTKPGTALPYTISANDGNGHTGLFVPLGIPPMVVGNSVTIELNSKPLATLPENSATVPLYPIIQLLKAEGSTVQWNGHTLTVTNSKLPKIPNMGGEGPYSVVINGQTVYKTTGDVAKDPSTHRDTTYISTDIFTFLVNISNRQATFAGNVLNVNTAPAAAGQN
ncbi:MAG: hypothetical protein K6T78_07025 [Alicyclobacillus sp.]|nr:hypothetical protein [Alicyclobacillus sp.]